MKLRSNGKKQELGGIAPNPSLERFGPRVQLNFCFDGKPRMDIRPFAEMSLLRFNDDQRSPTQLATGNYKLVRVVKCVVNRGPCRYHLNFIAIPENGSDADKKLFFAEVKWDESADGGKGDYVNSCCCIIGRPGTVTGLNGCNLMCSAHPRLVQHPVDGFTKERYCSS